MTSRNRNKPVTESYLDERLDERLDGLKKDLLGMKVEIVKEIRDMREEFDVHQASHSRINDEIEDHEERITTLEQKPL